MEQSYRGAFDVKQKVVDFTYLNNSVLISRAELEIRMFPPLIRNYQAITMYLRSAGGVEKLIPVTLLDGSFKGDMSSLTDDDMDFNNLKFEASSEFKIEVIIWIDNDGAFHH